MELPTVEFISSEDPDFNFDEIEDSNEGDD